MYPSRNELPRLQTWVGTTRELALQITDRDGVVQDLTGFDSATFSANLGDEAKISSLAVTIDAGTEGWVRFTPDPADLDTAGDYMGQVRLVDGSNVAYTDPVVLEVGTPIHNA